MYLRLAFAVAAHLEPEILLVDEVLAVGDAAFQKKCLGKMGEVANEGRTVLFREPQHAGDFGTGGAVDPASGGQGCPLRRYEQRDQGVPGERMGQHDVTGGSQRAVGHGRTALHGLGGVRRIGPTRAVSAGGQPAIFRLHYTCNRPVRAWSLVLDMLIRDSLGFPVCTLSTRFAPLENETLDSEGAVECHIPQLLLAQESYSADLWCVLNNVITDYVQNIALAPVQDCDFFGTGAMPVKRKHGSLLMPHEWRPARSLSLAVRGNGCA